MPFSQREWHTDNSFDIYSNRLLLERNLSMTEKRQEVYMRNTGSLVELELSQRLIHHHIVTVEKENEEHPRQLPEIIFNVTERNVDSHAQLESLIGQANTDSNPIFIISHKSSKANFNKRQLSRRPIVEIRLDAYFANLLKTYDNFHSEMDDLALTDFDVGLDKIALIIFTYMKQKPKQGEYIIEEIYKQNQKPIIGIIGLGYVGLSVAVGFAKKYNVIGFDIDEAKINFLQQHIDRTGEVSEEELRKAQIEFTDQEQDLRRCQVFIIAVPTPITKTNEPDLSYLIHASNIVGKQLSPGSIVIYESTVFPGATEQTCIPELEKASQLKSGIDFSVGYSPERMNPGDKNNPFTKINKIVAGQDQPSLEKIATLYESVLEAEVYRAPSIQVAEAAKLVENTQRDINIAFMNEIAMMFDKININTTEVLKAAQTKWNFLPFSPGLVGGHCISVDPYYLMYPAKRSDYEPRLIQTGRQINDDVPQYIVNQLLALMIKHKFDPNQLKVTVLGLTFKENVPDLRNSKALEIVRKLQNLGVSVQVCDPVLPQDSLLNEEITLTDIDQLDRAQILVLAVPHKHFSFENREFFTDLLDKKHGVVMDIKSAIPSHTLPDYIYHWQL